MPDIERLLWLCLTYFAHLDESNAAIHCADVRYSPITFRLAEALSLDDETVRRVMAHSNQYEEDKGR
jgi:hypothetical protein